MKLLALSALLIFSGCAVNSGVVAMGQDTYLVSRQAATGFSGMANLKVEAIGEASQFCGAQGRSLQVVRETDAQPPYILGNYPKTEIQFRCV